MRFSFGIRFGKVSVKIIADQFFLNMHTHQPATQSRALKKHAHLLEERLLQPMFSIVINLFFVQFFFFCQTTTRFELQQPKLYASIYNLRIY